MIYFVRIAGLVCSASWLMAVPSAIVAQSLPQPEGYDALTTIAPAAVSPYDFAILGVKPGMAIEDALALIETHLSKELLPVGGTLQVTSPEGKTFRSELRVSYETPGIDYFLRNQSQEPYDSVTIDVSTPAIGSVVTAIRREVRVSASEGPDMASLNAQRVGLYGPHSDLPDAFGEMWRWALDRDYAPIPMPEPYNRLSYQACAYDLPSDGRFSYGAAPALCDDRNCGMSYTAEYSTKGAVAITMNFRLIDYNLIVQDREAAMRLIDETLNTEIEPADMDL